MFDHIAHKTIVIVDPKYVANIIAKDCSGCNIHEYANVRDMINIIVHDWTNVVNNHQIRKKIQGLIVAYSPKSKISVINHSHSFIKENARNIIPKLRKNLLIDTAFVRRERKFTHIAQKNIKGSAIFATSKLNQTIPKSEAVIQEPTFDHKIIANADVRERIQVQTKANTRTDTTFELCNIVVINIPLPNDFILEDVNFFKKFLNHQFVSQETDCSK